jgi:hypothetical protein
MLDPEQIFWSPHYLRHNQRRQEHLASLGLDLANQRVLEVGAGVGDHTSFFLDRGCTMIVTEPQEGNLRMLRSRYPALDVRSVDLNSPGDPIAADVVYCYGTLYHLSEPAIAIEWMSAAKPRLLLLETCVSAQPGIALYPFNEQPGQPDNAVSGEGCRPTRGWIRDELLKQFAHVYCTATQPWHEEFPLDWSDPGLSDRPLIRSVFVASPSALALPQLKESLPTRQTRH